MFPPRTVEHAGSGSEIKTQGTWGKPGFTLWFPCSSTAWLAVHSSVMETILQEKKGMHQSLTLGTGLLQDLKVLHKQHSWDTEDKESGQCWGRNRPAAPAGVTRAPPLEGGNQNAREPRSALFPSGRGVASPAL